MVHIAKVQTSIPDLFIIEAKEELINLALTHPSFTKEKGELDSLENYERLEFFGDSVLKLFTSNFYK